jgi:hypothetical protein
MTRWFSLAALVLSVVAAPVNAAGITGKYIETRTCDIWVAPCFANAEMNLTGKYALMGWKVDKGSAGDVNLEGLSVVAVVAARDTLGLKQTGPAKAILIVDARATTLQREALIQMAKKEGGELLRNVIDVQSAPIELTACQCKGGACARLQAGTLAHIETRCIDSHHDKSCGNEYAFYPPLAKTCHAQPAVAVEHSFSGKGFQANWKEAERRGAYVGDFKVE